jgi:uncharacterized protein (TIGR03067 family)
MKSIAVATAFCVAASCSQAIFADEAKDTLQGVWLGQTMEIDGNPVAKTAAQAMRMTFQPDALLFKGNIGDREEKCTYRVDGMQTPKQLDFTPPGALQSTVLGIYELKGDQLTVCFRHGDSDKGRPKEFATKSGSQLILLVFKKQ